MNTERSNQGCERDNKSNDKRTLANRKKQLSLSGPSKERRIPSNYEKSCGTEHDDIDRFHRLMGFNNGN